MGDEKVSVIITTYNTDDSLRRAVESVKSQSYTRIEILVVDDNNPGTTGRMNAEKIMKAYSQLDYIKYIRHERNKNGSAARNTGIRNSSGTYISFLDDDDAYCTERIEKCVDALNSYPDYDAVYTAVCLSYKNGEKVIHPAEISGYAWKELLLNEGLLGTGSNLFLRRCAVEDVKGFDESFRRYQDVEFMLRVLQNHQMLAINEVLVDKYIYDRNIPNYMNYREIRAKVFTTFSELIDCLSEEEKQFYYIKNYRELLTIALYGGRKKEIKQAAAELKQYRRLTTKEKIYTQFPFTLKIWNLLKT